MIIDKINKLTLPATIIITSLILGGFYFASQIAKQISIERQQQIKIEQERQAKEEAKQALNTCRANAYERYSDRWNKECKRLGKLTSECIDILELSFDEYLKKYGLTRKEYIRQRGITDDETGFGLKGHLAYYGRRDECSCLLSAITADRFNEDLEKDRAECFKRHPQK